MENIRISNVCGLCAGCNYAILTSKKCKRKFGNVVVFKDIVHNQNVIDGLKDCGISFTSNLEDINENSHVILRAHGEPPETYRYLEKKGIGFTDCTCINIKKIHEEVQKYSRLGFKVIILGKHGKTAQDIHPEVLGTVGWCDGNCVVVENFDDLRIVKSLKDKKLYLTCQTTFNMGLADELIEKIKGIARDNGQELVVNRSICLAQQKINEASAELAKQVDLMVVVGSHKSSNSTELAKNLSKYAQVLMLEDIKQVRKILKENHIVFWFAQKEIKN